MALDAEDKRVLCAIARNAVTAAVTGGKYSPPTTDRPALLEKRGCFVTLTVGGRLRGCIGCFTSDRPLYLTVAEYAGHSALNDPRFAGDRLGEADLPRLEIDVSALSPLQATEHPENIELGVHGIYVRSGGRSGCFLPQVATETGWTTEEFWGHCCRDKAGLEWDAWKRPGTTTEIFTAEVFGC